MDERDLSNRIKQHLLLVRAGFPIIGLRECGDDLSPFCTALSNAVDHNTYGPYVDKHDPEELRAAGARAFLSRDGMAGIGVWPDGNIRAVFNDVRSSRRNAIGELMLTALSAGGDRLDCFDGFLSILYPMFGFIPVVRVKFDPRSAPVGWRTEFGTPDIIFFRHCGDAPGKVISSYRHYPNYHREDFLKLPLISDYDEAYKIRNTVMAEQPI